MLLSSTTPTPTDHPTFSSWCSPLTLHLPHHLKCLWWLQSTATPLNHNFIGIVELNSAAPHYLLVT